jgi:ribosomal protein S3
MVSDEKIRKYLIKAYDNAQIVKIEIERKDNKNSFDKAVPPSIDILVYCGQIGLFGEDVITVASKEIQKNVGRKYKVNLKPIAYDNVY